MNENKIMRVLREVNGYTQEYVASVLEIGQNTYSKLESGQIRLTSDRIRKLSKLYNVQPDYFFSSEIPIVNYNSGASSHSGPIHTYNNNHNSAKIVKELYEKVIAEKDEQINLLHSELSTLRKEREHLINLIDKLSAKISS